MRCPEAGGRDEFLVGLRWPLRLCQSGAPQLNRLKLDIQGYDLFHCHALYCQDKFCSLASGCLIKAPHYDESHNNFVMYRFNAPKTQSSPSLSGQAIPPFQSQNHIPSAVP